jgi:hypothetical protein
MPDKWPGHAVRPQHRHITPAVEQISQPKSWRAIMK